MIRGSRSIFRLPRAKAPNTMTARVSITTPTGWRTDQLEMFDLTSIP